MLTEEEAEKVRSSLLAQLDSMNLSPEELETARMQIQSMSSKRLEEFTQTSCIFCSIAKEQIESYKIAENKDALVVLEINPISKGHSMLIPKKHVPLQEFNENVFLLLLKTVKNLSEKLKPKQTNITSSETSGHTIINILPIFGNETGKRTRVTKEELEELRKLLTEESVKKAEEKIKEKKEKPKEKNSEPEIIIEQAPVRIP